MSYIPSNYKMHVGDKGTTFQAVMQEELANKTIQIIDLATTKEQYIEIKRPGHNSDVFIATILGAASDGILEYKNNDASYLDQQGQIRWRGIVVVDNATSDKFYGEWIYDKVNP